MARPALRACSALAATVGMFACASSPQGRPDLLDFIVDGKSTITEVTEKLGGGERSFHGGEIWTYRLGRDKKGLFRPFVQSSYDSADWSGTDSDLVIVFDSEGVVREHSLVAIHSRP